MRHCSPRSRTRRRVRSHPRVTAGRRPTTGTGRRAGVRAYNRVPARCHATRPGRTVLSAGCAARSPVHPPHRPDAHRRGAPRRQEAPLAANPRVDRGSTPPEFEHDACGVAMVADLAGRRDHGIVRKAITALLRLEHRGAAGQPRSNTGDGAGHPDPDPGRVLPRGRRLRAPRRRRLRRRHRASCPSTQARGRRRRGRDRRARRRGGPARARAGASCPSTPTAPTSGPPRRACMPYVPPAVRRRASRPAAGCRRGIELERRTFCLRKRAEHATGVVLPVAVPAHHRLQGHADRAAGRGVLPGPLRRARHQRARPWCTRASPPTRSRRGRSRTRTATSRTTARSTRCAATGTGWRAREALLRSDLIPGDLERLYPDRHPGRERLGHVRRGAGAAAPRRAAACRTRC